MKLFIEADNRIVLDFGQLGVTNLMPVTDRDGVPVYDAPAWVAIAYAAELRNIDKDSPIGIGVIIDGSKTVMREAETIAVLDTYAVGDGQSMKTIQQWISWMKIHSITSAFGWTNDDTTTRGEFLAAQAKTFAKRHFTYSAIFVDGFAS